MLRFELVDGSFESLGANRWLGEGVTNYVFQLSGVESDDVLFQLIRVHVCCEVCVGDGRIRRGDHLCPLINVNFIDFFHEIFKLELHAHIR